MKKTLVALAASAAAALTCLTGATAQAVVPTTHIRPATLDRGANGTVPHLVRSALVDGTDRYTFGKRAVTFLGMSDGDYLVGTWREGRPRSQRVVRVTPEDQRSVVLRRIDPIELTLSHDGQQLVRGSYRFHRGTTGVRVWSALDGSVVASRTFQGYVYALDASAGRVVLSGTEPVRTFTWELGVRRLHTISDRAGYRADIGADRLAVMTKDPYQGGCSVVSALSDPTTRLWRSCDQAVLGFAQSGNRMATSYILADGLGPGRIEVHRLHGKLLARYDAYYIGTVLWESDDTVLIQAHGRKKSAWVRCRLDDCERASRLWRTRA